MVTDRPVVRVCEAPNAWVRRALRLLLLTGNADVFEVQVLTRQGPRTVARRDGEYFARATRAKLLHDYALFGLDCWCRVLALSPGDVLLEDQDLDALVARADERWDASDWTAAAELFGQAAGLGVLHSTSYERLAISLVEIDDPARALSCFEMAKLIDPADTTIRRNLALAYRRWDRVTDAAAELIVAAALEGRCDALLEFADACLDDDDLDGAELGYRAALAMTPGDAELQWVLANVLDDNDKPDEAASMYERARAGMRPSADLEYDVGVHLKRRGARADAERHLERALALQPDHARAIVCLARLRSELGRDDEAITLLEDLLRLHPDDEEIAEVLRDVRDSDRRRDRDR